MHVTYVHMHPCQRLEERAIPVETLPRPEDSAAQGPSSGAQLPGGCSKRRLRHLTHNPGTQRKIRQKLVAQLDHGGVGCPVAEPPAFPSSDGRR